MVWGAGSLFVADVVFYDVGYVCVGVLVLFVCVAIGFVGISCVSRYFAWCCVLVSVVFWLVAGVVWFCGLRCVGFGFRWLFCCVLWVGELGVVYLIVTCMIWRLLVVGWG